MEVSWLRSIYASIAGMHVRYVAGRRDQQLTSINNPSGLRSGPSSSAKLCLCTRDTPCGRWLSFDIYGDCAVQLPRVRLSFAVVAPLLFEAPVDEEPWGERTTGRFSDCGRDGWDNE